MYQFKGMVAAMTTPFNEDETINYDGFKKILNHLVDGGMHGVLIGGSTGEYSLMSMDERKSIIKAACDQAKGKIDIIAGASCHRPKDTIEMVKFAAEAGADAVLVIPPYYLKTSRQGIVDYYQEISDNSSIGIVIYHYPDATGVLLDPELVLELSKIEKVIGIKNTAEMEHTSKLIDLFKDDENFGVINGFEHLIMGTLATGGDGTMGILHNLVPKEMVAIYDAMQKNDYQKALEINRKLAPLYTLMEEEPYPGPIKAALEMIGLPGGKPRKPIVSPTEGMKQRLKEGLKAAGVIK